MKFFLLLGLLVSFPSSAGVHEALKHCERPKDLHPYFESALEVYLDNEMFNTAFLRTAMWLHPQHESFAVCTVCEFGRENDPAWEAHLDLDCQNHLLSK